MSHDPTHHPHRPGADIVPCGVIVPLSVRRADRPAGRPDGAVPARRPRGRRLLHRRLRRLRPPRHAGLRRLRRVVHRRSGARRRRGGRRRRGPGRPAAGPGRPGARGPPRVPGQRPVAAPTGGRPAGRGTVPGRWPRPCDHGTCPPPSATDPWRCPPTSSAALGTPTLAAIGTSAGLAAVGIAGAAPFADTRADARGVAGPGPPRRDAVHLPQPGPLDRPGPHPGRGPVARRRRPGLPAPGPRRRDRRPRPDSGRPTGSIARYARHDHYRTCGPPSTRIAGHLAAAGWRARVVVDDNALVDRAAAQRAGLGWYGRNTLLLLPGLGSWSVLGTVVTDAPLDPTPPRGPSGPGGGVRHVPTLRLGLPDRGPRRRRRPRRPTLPGVAGPGTGSLPRGVPGGPRRPHLRVRRLPGGLPGQPDGRPPPAPPPARGGQHVPAWTCSACWTPPTPSCWRPTAAGTSPSATPRYLRRNALVALGNVGDGRRPGHGGDPDPLRHGATTRSWPSTPGWAARPAGPVRPRSARPPGPADDPPARHQRLPAQGGRDPGLPVGAVAPARPRLASPSSRRPPTPTPPPSTPSRRPAASASSGCRPGSSCPTPGLVRRIRDVGRAGRGRPGGPRPGLPPGRHRAPPRPALRRAAARGRGGHPRAAAGQPVACWPTIVRGARLVISAGGLPGGRGPAGRPGTGHAPGGRDPARRRPRALPRRWTTDERAPGPGRPGPARRRAPGGQCQPPRAPQGDGRAHRRRRRTGRPASRT